MQDAWLAAESDWACKRVEEVLYSPEGWERGQLLIAEDRPAWEADFWPPRAAEEVGWQCGLCGDEPNGACWCLCDRLLLL